MPRGAGAVDACWAAAAASAACCKALGDEALHLVRLHARSDLDALDVAAEVDHLVLNIVLRPVNPVDRRENAAQLILDRGGRGLQPVEAGQAWRLCG